MLYEWPLLDSLKVFTNHPFISIQDNYFYLVLFIAGTTAIGKTDLSLHLSKLINGEIISADSVQVYLI